MKKSIFLSLSALSVLGFVSVSYAMVTPNVKEEHRESKGGTSLERQAKRNIAAYQETGTVPSTSSHEI